MKCAGCETELTKGWCAMCSSPSDTAVELREAFDNIEHDRNQVRRQADEALRAASKIFHEIVGSYAAEKILKRHVRDDQPLPLPLYDTLVAKRMNAEQIEAAAADGFELCIRALAALGAKDVSIHECNARDMEEF